MARTIIGINGDVGAGKDAFFSLLPGKPVRLAFADALKHECSDWLDKTTLADAVQFLCAKHCDYETLTAIMAETWHIKLDSADHKLLYRACTFGSKAAAIAFANLHDAVRNRWVGRGPKALKWMHTREKKETFRTLTRWWGTGYRRVQCRDDYWIEQMRLALTRVSEKRPVVFTDTRFPNEAMFVANELKGVVIRIIRDGTEGSHVHISDTALDNWPFDFTVDNDGTLEDLAAKAAAIYEEITTDGTRTETF